MSLPSASAGRSIVILMEGVAHAGMGEPFIVENEAAAPAAAAKFRAYVESPVLTNIRVQALGFDTYDVQPMNFPDMFAQRPIILFGKYRGPVGGTFQLTGLSGSGDLLRHLMSQTHSRTNRTAHFAISGLVQRSLSFRILATASRGTML